MAVSCKSLPCSPRQSGSTHDRSWKEGNRVWGRGQEWEEESLGVVSPRCCRFCLKHRGHPGIEQGLWSPLLSAFPPAHTTELREEGRKFAVNQMLRLTVSAVKNTQVTILEVSETGDWGLCRGKAKRFIRTLQNIVGVNFCSLRFSTFETVKVPGSLPTPSRGGRNSVTADPEIGYWRPICSTTTSASISHSQIIMMAQIANLVAAQKSSGSTLEWYGDRQKGVDSYRLGLPTGTRTVDHFSSLRTLSNIGLFTAYEALSTLKILCA
eukprot:3838312-Rhodomonas_salina.5